MNNQYSGIYMMSWFDLKYYYFGQSINMVTRIGQHLRAFKRGDHDNNRLQNLYNKYGEPKFSFVSFCKPEELNEYEQNLLDMVMTDPGCCNINPSADNTRGWKRSVETKKILSDLRTGKSLSDEHKKNISIGLKRAYKLGRSKPDVAGTKNPFFNKKHDGDTRKRMSEVSKNCGSNNSKAKLVIDLQTGIFYDYAGEAAEAKGIKPQQLRKMLGGWAKNRTSLEYV